MLYTLKTLNDSTIRVVENNTFKYIVLICIAIYILFLDMVSTATLELFDLTSVKIILALLIVYTACFDPLYAIALTTLLIISIQELHRRRTRSASTSLLTSTTMPAVLSNPVTSQDLMAKQEVFNFINEKNMQKPHERGDLLVATMDFYEDPAYQTITSNLIEKNYYGHNKFFVTEDGLVSAQENIVPDVDQTTSVKVFNSTMGAQGLPGGYDKNNKY